MDDTAKRQVIERYWASAAAGQDLTDEIYHDDAVLEFPQSGERFEGVPSFREWRNVYPASVRLELRELRGAGDLWVAEALNVLEFRGDKVERETIYVTEPWEAPEWRAKWRAAP